MAVKKPIYITEKGYTQEINADLDSIEINSIQITAGGDIKVGAADGYGVFPVVISDDGYASFANGAFYVNPDGSVVSAAGALQVGADGALTVGTGAETASIDADGYMILSAIETTATDGYAILTEGGKFYVRASDGYVKIAGFAQLMGGMSLGSDLAVAGDLSVQQLADFNGGLHANAIKIDNDQVQRLYIVGDDGYMKDEEKLVFDGSKLSVTGNVELSGDLKVAGNDIKSSTDAVALTLSDADVAVAGDLTVTGNDIKSSSATAISLSGADVAVAGDLKVAGNDIKSSTDAVALTLSGADVAVAGDLTVTGNDIKSSSATALTLSGADVAVAGDLTVTGNDIKSSSATALTLSGADVAVAGDLTVTGNDIKSSSATAISLSGADVNVKGNLTVDGNIVADANENKAIFAAVGAGSTVTIASTGAEVAMPSAKVGDLTATRIVLAGTAGALEDSANLTFASNTLTVTGNADITGNFDVSGSFNVDGDTMALTGTAFSVDATGSFTVNSLADFNGGITTNSIKIDSDTPTFLYIVGSDGNIKDEEKLVFDGSKLSVNGDLEITGDMKVAGNDIKSSTGSIALTLSGTDVAVAGDLTVTGNDIKSSSATAISLSGADVAVAGDLTVTGNDIKSSSAVALTLAGADVTVAGDLKVAGNDIKSGSDVIALTLSGADVNVKGNLTVDGNIVADADEDKAIFAAVSTGHTVTIASAGAEVALPSAKVGDLTSGRIVLAGTAGALEDSVNLTFSAGLLSVIGDGYFSGALEVAGVADLNGGLNVSGEVSVGSGAEAISLDGATGDGYFAGALEVLGQVDLAAAGVATNVHGPLNVSQVADFNAGVISSGVKIDNDTPTFLYIVGADGYIKDESKLVFDGYSLSVDADGYFSGALEVAGAVSLHDDMSFVANKSISFAGNSGAVLGLANLDGYSDGYAAANKNYVDMMVAAAGLDAGNTSSSSLLAAESISIGDPIFIDSNGKAARGDTTSTLNEKAWVFGVAAAAAAADASVEVVRDGIAAGVLAGLGMSAGAKVWLKAGGGLTATKPAAGRLILMGFALSSSDLLVDVRDYGSFVA